MQRRRQHAEGVPRLPSLTPFHSAGVEAAAPCVEPIPRNRLPDAGTRFEASGRSRASFEAVGSPSVIVTFSGAVVAQPHGGFAPRT